ncbi:MAG: GGDEF domain-containing protein [Ruminococcus sp.]|nr:GGDEF domain-containing protein [Ruminococcus sp.]MCM1382714.1 GGDEF domain-containing protein [Muribaculaceae bacterium]MCM1480716.1 GGDEF domain-containing protein [Muribaculaceae bacterium]
MFNGKKIIAVLIPRVFDPAAFEYLQLLNECSVRQGCALFVYQTNTDFGVYSDNRRNDVGEEFVYDLIDFDLVDGMVIFSELLKNKETIQRTAAKARGRGIPVAAVEYPLDGCINFRYDYGDCFEKIVRHVIVDHGLTKVNFIAGIEGNNFSEERHDVYKKVLAEQGIPYDPERVGYGQFWDMPTIEVTEKFLADGKEPPQAIICSNDVMAMAACRVLSEHGYSVPGDVIVTGFDGIYDERFHNPRLTTCRNNRQEMVESILRALLDSIDGKEVPTDNVIGFEMVLSQSCGCGHTEAVNAFVILSEMNKRLNKYQYSTGTLSNKMAFISSVRDPALIPENLAGDEDFFDMCCCLNVDALSPKSGIIEYENENPFTDEMLMIFRGHYMEPSREIVRFNRKKIIPEFDKYINMERPVIFSVIHYFDIPLGYLCINRDMSLVSFERIPQVTDAYGNGFGNVRVYTAMERLYTYDPLTELYNRRGFYQLIVPKFEKAIADGDKIIAIVSSDLDGLKGINDTYGHYEGDSAIKVVADALHHAAVDGEICARFGGDEFVVAGVIANEEGYAEGFKNRVKAYIDAYNKTSGKPYSVAASIGITCKKPDGSTVDELIKASDDLMYADKATRKIVRSRARY